MAVAAVLPACQETVPPMEYSEKGGNSRDNSSGGLATGGGTTGTSSTGRPIPTDSNPLPTPDENTTNDDDATSGSAVYSQRGGFLTHPNIRGGAPITGGTMNVNFGQDQLTLSISGMTTSRSEARDGVRGMNGSTRFDRVLYANLPEKRRYKDHPYLIFANALTNKDNQRFTIKGTDLVPIYATAKDNVEAYMNLLKKGRVKYHVTAIGPGGGEVPLTFTVLRALDANLPACPGSPFTAATQIIDNVDRNFAVKIIVTGIPTSWKGIFPMTDTVYINNYANGGSTTTIATCREFYDSGRRKEGTVQLDFAR